MYKHYRDICPMLECCSRSNAEERLMKGLMRNHDVFSMKLSFLRSSPMNWMMVDG